MTSAIRNVLLALLWTCSQWQAFGQTPDDHGNTPATATVIPLNATVSGEIGPASDVDFFKLTVTSTTQIRLRVVIPNTPASTTYKVLAELMDPYQTVLYSTTDPAVFTYKPPVLTSLDEGTYFIKVSGAQGRYQLVIESKVDDHGDTRATATQVQLGSTFTGNIGFQSQSGLISTENFGDVDYFAFWIPGNGRLYLDTRSASLAQTGGLSIESSAGSTLTLYYSLSGPSGVFAMVGRGRHFIRVDGRIGAIDYTVTPRFEPDGPATEDDVGGSIFDAKALPLNSTVTGALETSNDLDSWRLDVPSAGALRIDVVGAGIFQGVPIDKSFRTLSSATNVSLRDGTQSIFALVQPGPYYLEAYAGSQSNSANYSIKTTFTPSQPGQVDDYANDRAGAKLVDLGKPIKGTLNYDGDVDVFKVEIPADGSFTVRSTGDADLVGWLTSSFGSVITANDDAELGATAFGFTQYLTAGTYFLHVAGAPGARGNYELNTSLFPASHNYTDLWWSSSESGWGLNVNHQGDTLFATLFVYDADGSGLWLVMSSGVRESFGVYTGTLYRTSGPAFNASPWQAINVTPVGSMTLSFTNRESGELTYTVNGVTVRKTITRQRFSQAPGCNFSSFDRSYASNYQDLWWNPGEPGWGINLTHQGNIVFATLFTYDSSGRPMWLVMSRGVGDGKRFAGDLYRVKGSPFNSNIWIPVTTTKVGTLTLTFTHGNAGLLEYSVDGVQVRKTIERQVFGTPATFCG